MDEKRIEAISLIRNMASKLKTYDDFTSAEQDAVEMAIDALKQKPVVKGEWIDRNGRYEFPCKCSICGHEESIRAKFLFSYCPNCGAKMSKGGD